MLTHTAAGPPQLAVSRARLVGSERRPPPSSHTDRLLETVFTMKWRVLGLCAEGDFRVILILHWYF